jgi:hypothetical protein
VKRSRHWTIYATITIALSTVGFFLYFWFQGAKQTQLELAVTEAGGVVHWDTIWEVDYLPWDGLANTVGMNKAVAVEISSGSHPIPEEMKYLKYIPSIRSLSLNTSVVGDHLVPLISTFRHLEVLDLSRTDISPPAAFQILDALPNLKVLRLSEGPEIESAVIASRHLPKIQLQTLPRD